MSLTDGRPSLHAHTHTHTVPDRSNARTCGLAALSKVLGPSEARAAMPRPGSPMLWRRLNPLVDMGSSVPRRLLNAMAAASPVCRVGVLGGRESVVE